MADGSGVPAGWFDNVEQPGQERYWDGSAWTDQRRPKEGVVSSAGWYDEPYLAGWQRYWDGAAWTVQRRPSPETLETLSAPTGELPTRAAQPAKHSPLPEIVIPREWVWFGWLPVGSVLLLFLVVSWINPVARAIDDWLFFAGMLAFMLIPVLVLLHKGQTVWAFGSGGLVMGFAIAAVLNFLPGLTLFGFGWALMFGAAPWFKNLYKQEAETPGWAYRLGVRIGSRRQGRAEHRR